VSSTIIRALAMLLSQKSYLAIQACPKTPIIAGKIVTPASNSFLLCV
jgi:hypothetical protein